MKKNDKQSASFDVSRRCESSASYKTPMGWNRGEREFINRAINHLEVKIRALGESTDGFFCNQEGSGWGADHLVEEGVEVVQGPVK